MSNYSEQSGSPAVDALLAADTFEEAAELRAEDDDVPDDFNQ